MDEVDGAIASYREKNKMEHVNINEGEYPTYGGSSRGHDSASSGQSMDEEDLRIML